MRSRLILITLFLNLFGLAPAWGIECAHVLPKLKKDYQPWKSHFLDPRAGDKIFESIQEAIQKIYSNSALLKKEKLEKSFAVYLQKRIENLTYEQIQRVKYLVDFGIRNEIIDSGSVEISSYFDPNNFTILMRFPTALKDTVLYYSTLAHELEHAIQFLVLGTQAVLPYPQWVPTYFPQHVFGMEAEAMIAESLILRATPLQELREVKEWVRGLSNLPKEKKDLSLNNIEAAISGYNSSQYVEYQHLKGRYSRAQLAKEQGMLTGKMALMGGIPIWLAYFLFLH